MALRYNKQIIKKDRTIQSRGPRDHQVSQIVNSSSESLVFELRTIISRLQTELDEVKNSKATALDSEIISIVKEETEGLNKIILNLKDEIKTLRVLLKDKDDFIAQLKNSTCGTSSTVHSNSLQRPEIEKQYIDPIENNSTVESHIIVDKVVSSDKEFLKDKISKLKKLQGLKNQ